MIKKERKICSICAKEKSSEFCEYCNECTVSNISTEIYGEHRIQGQFKIKGRRLGKVRCEVSSGWKADRDPKSHGAVYEDRIIDKDKNQYHQVVKDAITNKITHEEHEPLSNHKSNTAVKSSSRSIREDT